MKKIVSFSGGKDSTAMLFKLLDMNYQIDEVVFFNTGWEFPQLHAQVLELKKIYPITILEPRKSFDYWLYKRKVVSKKNGSVRYGYGWPSAFRRWCTSEKTQTISKYLNQKYGSMQYQQYVGFALDEKSRIKNFRHLYPFVDFGMTENDCLLYCYEVGFTWSGLYNYFDRVSCYCCPLQSLNDLRKIRKYFPDLWLKMMKKDSLLFDNRGFHHYKTLHDLESRFTVEDLQMDLFEGVEL
jgi:3'-phosphoadenosine 5'-phosphosulfate sulfotransferase (PAPS reductase)/FAD synthetase